MGSSGQTESTPGPCIFVAIEMRGRWSDPGAADPPSDATARLQSLTCRRLQESKGRAGERQGWRPVSLVGSTHWSGCSGCVWRNPEHRGAHTMRSPHRIRRGRDQTEASTAAASRTGKKARARDALSNHTGDMGNAAAPPLQHRLTLAGRHPSIRHTRTHTDMQVEHSV